MGYQDFGSRDIRSEFFRRLTIAEAGTFAARLGRLIGSDNEKETYRWLGAAPPMREWIGGRHEKRLRDFEYEIRNKLFEATLDLYLPDVRRDKTGQIMARVGDLATRAALHWDSLLSALIIAGEDTACYDGKYFFATDHTEGDSGTQDNDIGYDAGTATAPTAAEMAGAILEAIQQLYGFVDDTGEPINQDAMQFAVMIPVPFLAATVTALSAQYLTNGVTNPVLASGFQIRAIPNPRLTWTTKFATFREDGALGPFILQEEEPITTDFIGRGSETEFHENRWKFGVKATRNVGFGLWQHACLTTFS